WERCKRDRRDARDISVEQTHKNNNQKNINQRPAADRLGGGGEVQHFLSPRGQGEGGGENQNRDGLILGDGHKNPRAENNRRNQP
ncbi:hypothetical protein CWI43_06335, partial [Neisseria meningitidis]